jgi:hypothetical protein
MIFHRLRENKYQCVETNFLFLRVHQMRIHHDLIDVEAMQTLWFVQMMVMIPKWLSSEGMGAIMIEDPLRVEFVPSSNGFFV